MSGGLTETEQCVYEGCEDVAVHDGACAEHDGRFRRAMGTTFAAQPAAEPGDVNCVTLSPTGRTVPRAEHECAKALDLAGLDAASGTGLYECARAVLASDWLARHDAETAARAWDEGRIAGRGETRAINAFGDHETATNPYRAAAIRGGGQ